MGFLSMRDKKHCIGFQTTTFTKEEASLSNYVGQLLKNNFVHSLAT